MPIAERRDTDEMLAHIAQHENQRKLWMLLTLVGFIITTAVLFNTAPTAGASLPFALAVNGGFAILSILYYRARVRGKDRIGMIMPTMLAIVSTVLVWVLSVPLRRH